MSFASNPEARDHRLQLVEPRRRRLAADKARRTPDLARDRIEGVVDVVRRALVAHPHMRLVADLLAQRRQNARLADARLARDAARPGPRPRSRRASGRGAAPPRARVRRRASSPCDRDASKRLTFSASRKTVQAGTGASKPLRAWGPSVFNSNAPPSSRRVDPAMTTLSRLGERLQPRRQIGRLANDGLFLRRSLTDEVADHDDAGGYADADVQS